VSTPSLELKPLRRGVTHDTRLVLRDGAPVAVLRLAPPGAVALPGLDVQAEGALLRALDAPGVPRPRLLEAGEWDGRPGLKLEYVAGERAAGWPEDALDVLLALHRSPFGVVAGLDGSARARVAALRGGVDDGVLDALLAGAPACAVPTWTHGDYRPANLVVRDGRIAAVLDWEMAGIGDPARDLGIATMGAWGAWLPDEELVRRYRARGGQEIELRRLRWWRCLGYAMVVAFLHRRARAGWQGGPEQEAFATGLRRAFEEWRACR
jgi:aminoglycoside phosphotransferase (APT) family kinase protein